MEFEDITTNRKDNRIFDTVGVEVEAGDSLLVYDEARGKWNQELAIKINDELYSVFYSYPKSVKTPLSEVYGIVVTHKKTEPLTSLNLNPVEIQVWDTNYEQF